MNIFERNRRVFVNLAKNMGLKVVKSRWDAITANKGFFTFETFDGACVFMSKIGYHAELGTDNKTVVIYEYDF